MNSGVVSSSHKTEELQLILEIKMQCLPMKFKVSANNGEVCSYMPHHQAMFKKNF
jgi:hypothetical protein